MYDAVELAKKTESLVCLGDSKKYYLFRPTRFYGGIATADTVGCDLRCVFCWSGASVWNAAVTGTFYSPSQIAAELHEIARRKGYSQVRVSGGEPTIGRSHLIALLGHLHPSLSFILETNGILLGADPSYVDALSRFHNLHVRVCLKGCSPEEFTWLTGATSTGFTYQFKALERLRDAQMRFNIAVVSLQQEKEALLDKLTAMGLGKIMIEEEELTLYPEVKKRLQQTGLLSAFERKER